MLSPNDNRTAYVLDCNYVCRARGLPHDAPMVSLVSVSPPTPQPVAEYTLRRLSPS